MPAGANFLAVPVLSSDNALLFIGSDSGKVYCLDAPNTDAQLGSAAARAGRGRAGRTP